MAGMSFIRLSLVVHGVCLLGPCVTSLFCNNHTECVSKNPYTPFCCGHILRFCADKCDGNICNTDENCGDGECCYNAESYCTNELSLCTDHCVTKNDCAHRQCCKDGRCNFHLPPSPPPLLHISP